MPTLAWRVTYTGPNHSWSTEHTSSKRAYEAARYSLSLLNETYTATILRLNGDSWELFERLTTPKTPKRQRRDWDPTPAEANQHDRAWFEYDEPAYNTENNEEDAY